MGNILKLNSTFKHSSPAVSMTASEDRIFCSQTKYIRFDISLTDKNMTTSRSVTVRMQLFVSERCHIAMVIITVVCLYHSSLYIQTEPKKYPNTKIRYVRNSKIYLY